MARVDPRNTESDDFTLDPHQHPPKRLGRRIAIFCGEGLKARDRAQPRQQAVDSGALSSDEKIDSFRAKKDRSAKMPAVAKCQ